MNSIHRHPVGLWRLLVTLAVLTLGAVAMAQRDVPPTLELRLQGWSGATISGELRVTFAPGLHAYQNPPSETWMIPISISTSTQGVRLNPVRYPRGERKVVGGTEEPAMVHGGTIRIPFRLTATGAARPNKIAIHFRYQQCDATTCFAPRTLRIEAAPGANARLAPPDAGGKTLAGASGAGKAPVRPRTEPERPAPEGTPAAGRTTNPGGGLGHFLSSSFRDGNYALIILGAIVVGLGLCLTPCVYPVIPITVSYFSNQTSGSITGRVGLGLMYMVGIAATYGVVGGVAAALGGAVGALFTMPWFLFLLASIMIGLGLSMFGLYEIGIPRAIGKHIKGRQGPIGALLMGLLVGVAAAPCAGALVSGIAIEVARIGEVALGILVFTAIGAGIGLPFVALATVSSSGFGKLPKSGSWLDAVKAVLGIAVMYLAFDYLLKGFGFRVGDPTTLYIWAGFFCGAALFLLWFKVKNVTPTTLVVKGAAVLSLGFFGGSAYTSALQVVKEREFERLGVARSIPWQKFTPETFAAAKASGKPVLIDITADWCVKCREIDRRIFQTARAVRASQGVVALKIDHSTGVDPAYIAATTKLFGVTGLPHIEVLRPGGERSEVVFDIPSIEAFEASLRKAGATW